MLENKIIKQEPIKITVDDNNANQVSFRTCCAISRASAREEDIIIFMVCMDSLVESCINLAIASLLEKYLARRLEEIRQATVYGVTP
ncbi:Uncharacterised protein [Fluoribacter dumoffii]|uniref:Uncharacterized protein n=1 Tax=Fluoribacter dumoffii TaxID=463 RepID=A0A377G6S6_9GAMM|nr:hypothetical protein Ldum_0423 [Fluoribacter dumoffii NY 23]STO20464.1 Uncharacterised protein [Fluoribacter dumoffii]